MLLNEVFNTQTQINVTGNTSDAITIEFTVNGMEFLFTASNDTWEDDQHVSWNIEFGLRKSNGEVDYDQTNTGNAYTVFAAVQQCTLKLIELHPEVGQVVFTAKKQEQSRVKLYDRLVRSLRVPGWTSRKEIGGFNDFYIFYKTE